jgi:outer membrane protein assembly factor BamB
VDPVLVFPEEIVPTGCAVSADGRRLYFGSYRGGLYEADLSPNERTAGTPGRIPGIDASVIDVARGPDGTIYLATTDSLLRLAGTPTGSPVPVGSPTSSGSDGDVGTGIGLVIAAVLIGGLILLRRRILRR